MLSEPLESNPVGPVTKYAILGVIFGVIALPIWALGTGQLSLQASLLAGFGGGLTAGTAWGLAKKYLVR
jgi:hypothetical protein